MKKEKDLLNFLFAGLAIKIVFLSDYFISHVQNAGAVDRLFSALASQGTLHACVECRSYLISWNKMCNLRSTVNNNPRQIPTQDQRELTVTIHHRQWIPS